jgi:putative intracellular protease/amidase
MSRKEIDVGLLFYPRFTALDAIGPYEVLREIPAPRSRSWPSALASFATSGDWA